MTATKKLFVAVLILAGGFGVARLMGQPAARWYAPQPLSTPPPARSEAKVAKPIGDAVNLVSLADGARLVPDFSTENPYRVRDDASEGQLASSPREQVYVDDSTAISPFMATNSAAPPPFHTGEPRAKLRDEAPRPLDFDSRQTTAGNATLIPTAQNAEIPPVAGARSAAADWRASGLTPAEYLQDAAGAATLSAAYSRPLDASTPQSTVAPPPWPEPAAASDLRTHVVVDGDSLERLAGRYLDDSRRAHEIYEANRELLASPELLPIGAELVIPKKSNRAAFDNSFPQSSIANEPSLRAAAHRGMVYVPPIPSAASVLPRAQLLPPVPAE